MGTSNEPTTNTETKTQERYVSCGACGGSGLHQACGSKGCAGCNGGYCDTCKGQGGWYQ